MTLDHGEMERVTARIPKAIVADLEYLEEQGYYSTRSDVIRDACRRLIIEFGGTNRDIEPRGPGGKPGIAGLDRDIETGDDQLDPKADLERIRELRKEAEADEPDEEPATAEAPTEREPEKEVVSEEPAPEVLDHTDADDLELAYEDAEGNVAEAAERFELGYSAIYRRMVDAGVHDPTSYGAGDGADESDRSSTDEPEISGDDGEDLALEGEDSDGEVDARLDEDELLDHTDPEDLQRAYDEADGVISKAAERFDVRYETVYRYLVDHLIHEPEPQSPYERASWCSRCGGGPMTEHGAERHIDTVHDGDAEVLDHEPDDEAEDGDADEEPDEPTYTIDNPEGYLTTLSVGTSGVSTANSDVCDVLGIAAGDEIAYWTQDGAVHVVGPDGPAPPADTEGVWTSPTRPDGQKATFSLNWTPLKRVGAIAGGHVKLFDRDDRVVVRAVGEDGELLGFDHEPDASPLADDDSPHKYTTGRQPDRFVDWKNRNGNGDGTLRGLKKKLPEGVTADRLRAAVYSGECRTIGDVCEFVGMDVKGDGRGRGPVRDALRRLDLYEELRDPEGDNVREEANL